MKAFELALGFFVGVVFTIMATLAAKDEYKTHIESYQMGIKHALRTNPVSWELEEACMSLWIRKEHEAR
jgi:hypothetical protein